MRITKSLAILSALLIVATGLSGCETTGEAAGLGALIGAGAGALIGAGSGHAAAGAIIGGGLGAASGAVAHDVQETRSRQYRSAEATYQQYNYQPASQAESLTFEDAKVQPSIVRRGNMVEVTMQYAILGTGSGKEVMETRMVKRNGELISQISSKAFTRNDGAWASIQEFRIPESWDPGEYTLEQVVSTSQLSISGIVKFYIE